MIYHTSNTSHRRHLIAQDISTEQSVEPHDPHDDHSLRGLIINSLVNCLTQRTVSKMQMLINGEHQTFHSLPPAELNFSLNKFDF